jgi:hypothetical protein
MIIKGTFLTIRKEAVVAYLRYPSGITLDTLEKITINYTSDSRNPTTIRTRYLPNESVEYYGYTNLLSVSTA